MQSKSTCTNIICVRKSGFFRRKITEVGLGHTVTRNLKCGGIAYALNSSLPNKNEMDNMYNCWHTFLMPVSTFIRYWIKSK